MNNPNNIMDEIIKDKTYVEGSIDRFAEVAKGLGLEHHIAEKIANFIFVEVKTAEKEALTQQKKEMKERAIELSTNQDSVEEYVEWLEREF